MLELLMLCAIVVSVRPCELVIPAHIIVFIIGIIQTKKTILKFPYLVRKTKSANTDTYFVLFC